MIGSRIYLLIIIERRSSIEGEIDNIESAYQYLQFWWDSEGSNELLF